MMLNNQIQVILLFFSKTLPVRGCFCYLFLSMHVLQRKKYTGQTNSCIPKITQNRYDNDTTNMIIAQIIFTIFTYCCLNNLSEKRLKIRAIQNTVVLKIKIVMVHTPFVIVNPADIIQFAISSLRLPSSLTASSCSSAKSSNFSKTCLLLLINLKNALASSPKWQVFLMTGSLIINRYLYLS